MVGMTTAMVSMKPVASHCTVDALTWRSIMSRWRATFMMVSLRITTKVATSRVTMTVTDSRDIFPDTGPAAGTCGPAGAASAGATAGCAGFRLAVGVGRDVGRHEDSPRSWIWCPAIDAGED